MLVLCVWAPRLCGVRLAAYRFPALVRTLASCSQRQGMILRFNHFLLKSRLTDLAFAVDVVAKARAYGDAPHALRLRELWAALALARRVLQQRGILSLRMAPVAARPNVEFPAAEFFAGVAAPPAAQQQPAYTWEQQPRVRRRASRGAASPHE